jgi:uncharacterized protein YjbI with pentapeptide repeats
MKATLDEQPRIQFPLLEDTRIEYANIHKYSFLSTSNVHLVFDTVSFRDCTFKQCSLERAEFIDCVFHNCEFTNNTLQNSLFVRCEFYDSKLDGSHFVESLFEHVLVKNCSGKFLDFSDTTLKVVDFVDTSLRESVWFTTKIKQVRLLNINLQKADFYETSLKSVDLSSSLIDGMRIDLKGIQGASIAEDQAVLLCNLIGVDVIEEA